VLNGQFAGELKGDGVLSGLHGQRDGLKERAERQLVVGRNRARGDAEILAASLLFAPEPVGEKRLLARGFRTSAEFVLALASAMGHNGTAPLQSGQSVPRKVRYACASAM